MYNVSFDLDFKRNTHPGKFIVIEGIDGSGKTTQAQQVVESLTRLGKKVVYTKEPTDGPIGLFIREVLAGKVNIPSVSFQYLFAADRAAHQDEIETLLKEGNIVIADRYFWSAIAYGMADREHVDYGNPGKLLLVGQSILSMYNQFVIPDTTIYLRLSAENAMQRLSSMDKEKEIYEKKEKLEKIEKGYEWLLQEFPKEFTVIDGQKSVEDVTSEIVSTITA